MDDKFNFKSIVLAVITFWVSTGVSASVFNTINGTNYEWVELTATAGLSRAQVELKLLDSNDVLFGYEYASRALVKDLLISYSSWDGLDGEHGDSDVVSGMKIFLDDFGRTFSEIGTGVNITGTTIDGYVVDWDSTNSSNYGLYGLTNECGFQRTCRAYQSVSSSANGTPVMTTQHKVQGWDNTSFPQQFDNSYASEIVGSYLVRNSVVPVPAAIWLFGSGLLGLIGVARRKK